MQDVEDWVIRGDDEFENDILTNEENWFRLLLIKCNRKKKSTIKK